MGRHPPASMRSALKQSNVAGTRLILLENQSHFQFFLFEVLLSGSFYAKKAPESLGQFKGKSSKGRSWKSIHENMSKLLKKLKV